MFFIHVVQSGESLFSIANIYKVPLKPLQDLNGIISGALVPGQDIVVHTSFYIVQPGDSLYTIARKAFISVQSLMQANRLHSHALTPGMRLYLPQLPKYNAENLSYLFLSTPAQDEPLIKRFAPINTFYGIFEYHILPGGELSSLKDTDVVRIARSNHVAPLATITNLTSQGFSQELAYQVLTYPDQRNRLINNLYHLVKNKNYAGVNIDIERVRESERDLFTGFLSALHHRLKPEGYYVTVTVTAKTNDNIPWLLGYDFGGIGAASDFVFIMAYDWNTPASDPGPVAPIGEVRRAIEYALARIPANKIILGLPRYGYDWIMSNGKSAGGSTISTGDAINLAGKHQVPIQYSTEYEQPHFTYRDETGKRHVVWFEDAKARVAKLKLVSEYHLRGVGAWQLGLHFPTSGFIVNELFKVKKII